MYACMQKYMNLTIDIALYENQSILEDIDMPPLINLSGDLVHSKSKDMINAKIILR